MSAVAQHILSVSARSLARAVRSSPASRRSRKGFATALRWPHMLERAIVAARCEC